MKYWRAYTYFFDSPKWTMNLLLGTLCSVIPLIGQIVFHGYGYEAVETMHRRGKDDQYPEFDFNRFVKYLVRGCWPFIWQLIIGLPVVFVMWFFYFIFMMVMLGTGGKEGPNPAVMLIGILFLVVVVLALSLVVAVVLAPLQLRAGLSQELGFNQALAFVQEFLKRVGKELVLAQLFLLGTAIVILPIATMMCVLPVYPAAVVVQMAQFHLLNQLYGLYLERGGTAIPIVVGPVPV
jgi:hypothetical protein